MCFQTSQLFSQQKGELIPHNLYSEYMHLLRTSSEHEYQSIKKNSMKNYKKDLQIPPAGHEARFVPTISYQRPNCLL